MEWMEPMEPVRKDSVVKGDRWIHQVKWDGIRGLGYVEDSRVHLYTRSGRERIAWYPEISGMDKVLDCRQAVLDGELIVLNDQGIPSFHHIMTRERVKRKDRLAYYQKKHPVQYMVFDMLFRDGKDLRQVSLMDRKEILNETLNCDGTIRMVPDHADGDALFTVMKEKGMEGIVSKHMDSCYMAGKKHREWFKTKIIKQLLAVVCGVKMKEGVIKSLVLGVYENGVLSLIGNVSSGLSYKDREILVGALSQIGEGSCIFSAGKPGKDVIWLKPVLTVMVRFMERDPGGGLRHPVLIGFSSRKPIEANGKEEPV